ncbi:hypothetical protein [Microbulbifer sp. 2205BS26-8]|uniref:hypothetical protein n=1 Tax=Microbulbifer sp. 2205BS26-8 TaxID=3064386 RepID=UPI00273D69D9|nr:hypothetical protein [Microbulbifer sp. 2205BS26-8]MDP5208376.1 hypothetical protein [Microbulbifer sp. 2205BS26-8]
MPYLSIPFPDRLGEGVRNEAIFLLYESCQNLVFSFSQQINYFGEPGLVGTVSHDDEYADMEWKLFGTFEYIIS